MIRIISFSGDRVTVGSRRAQSGSLIELPVPGRNALANVSVLDIRLARCASEHLGVSTIEVSRVTTETLKTGLTMLMAAAIGTTLGGNASAQDKPADWPSYNRTLSGERYAPQAA